MKEKYKSCGLNYDIIIEKHPNINEYEETVNAYLDDENMKAKIKNISQEHRTPYILVVGQKEKDEGSVCVRYRFSSKKPQETMKLEDFIKYVEQKNEERGTGI